MKYMNSFSDKEIKYLALDNKVKSLRSSNGQPRSWLILVAQFIRISRSVVIP